MPKILVACVPLSGGGGSIIGASGQILRFRHGLQTFTDPDLHIIPLPQGSNLVNKRPTWAPYNALQRSRLYGTGAFTANILIDENLRGLRVSLPAPTIVPSVALSGTGVTGNVIPYLRFVDSIGERVSPLSAPGASLAAANQGFAWTVLPTTCPDHSVDTIEGLRSVDGGEPRVAWRRQLGVTSVTENVATGILGDVADVAFTDMPLGLWNIFYEDGHFIGGNEQFPERLFRSAIGEPEHYEGLFLQSDGEALVGGFASNRNLFFGSTRKIYRATGFDENDLTREVEKPDIGLINHHGIVNAFKRVLVPTTNGLYLYDGSWTPLAGDRLKEWTDQYALYRNDYERAQGAYDPVSQVYRFGPVPHSEIGFGLVWTYWVWDGNRLFPDVGVEGFEVAIGNDYMKRKPATSCIYTLPGSGQPQFVTGFEDGNLRLENVQGNKDDDGDDALKTWVVEPPTEMPEPPGGMMDGHTFGKAWSYLEFDDHEETASWLAEFRAGGEKCRDLNFPDFSDETFSAHESFIEPEATTVHVLELVAGQCLNYRIVASAADPANNVFRGWAYSFTPGVNLRGRVVGGDPG